MTRPLFAPGSKVELDGKNAVISFENEHAFVLFFEGGRQREVSKLVMRTAFNEGRLKYRVDTPDSKLARHPYLTSAEAKNVQRLLAYLEPMGKSTKPGSKCTRERIISEVVEKHGQEVLPAPSEMTLYKWFKRWDSAGRNVLVLIPSCKGQRRCSRLAPEILDLLNDAIDKFILKRGPSTVQKAYRSFEHKVKALELECKIPSAQTFYNHVNAVHPLERTFKQQGNAAFQEASRTVTDHYDARCPLARVEIDAVHLTMGLIDEFLNLIANQVIVYIAIDVYSRAIVGFAMKYGMNIGEDAEGVISCFNSILRQKNVDYPHVKNEWFGGKPEVIVADPGSAIIAESFTELAGYYGVRREITEASQGWKKPHIESYFKTFRQDLMSEMPGHIPKRSPDSKGKVKLKEEACVTPEDFETMLVRYLVDGYNQSSHSALGNMTPHQKWLEGVASYGEPEMVEDLSFSNLFGGIIKTVGVDPKDGIRLHYLTYNSADLTRLYYELKPGKKGPKRPVKIRCSSQDLTKIAVFNEKTRTYLEVRCTTPVPEGMTLTKMQAYQKSKPKPVRPDTLTDSPELANSLDRLKQVKKKHQKPGRTNPDTTPAKALSDQELSGLFPDRKDYGAPNISTSSSSSEPGDWADVADEKNEPISTGSREFKLRERK